MHNLFYMEANEKMNQIELPIKEFSPSLKPDFFSLSLSLSLSLSFFLSHSVEKPDKEASDNSTLSLATSLHMNEVVRACVCDAWYGGSVCFFSSQYRILSIRYSYTNCSQDYIVQRQSVNERSSTVCQIRANSVPSQTRATFLIAMGLDQTELLLR